MFQGSSINVYTNVIHTLNSKYRFKNTLWNLVTQSSKENRLVAIKRDKNQSEFQKCISLQKNCLTRLNFLLFISL